MAFSPKARFKQGIPLMVDYTPSGAVSAGDVILANGVLGIAHSDIAAGVLGALSYANGNAVYTFVKDASTFAVNDVAYWDNSAKKATSTSSGNTFLGICKTAAATGVGSVDIQFMTISSAASFIDPLTSQITDPGASGAIPVTQSGYVEIVTAGAETRTMLAPTFVGQRMLLMFTTKVGNCVITVASTVNLAGNNTITFSTVGQAILLVAVYYSGALKWKAVAVDGSLLSTV
jgi:predicted RecA/RadA family phage recombinase